MKRLALALLIALPATLAAQHSAHGTKLTQSKAVTIEAGLGNVNHKVSTKNAEAQKGNDRSRFRVPERASDH